MFKILRNITLSFILSLSIINYSNANILNEIIISNLNNIITPINITVAKAQKDFLQNGFSNDNNTIKIIPSDYKSPYINSLEYNPKNLRIKLQFKTSQTKANHNINEELHEVDQKLSGKYIVLIPIVSGKNRDISSWECITDIEPYSENILSTKQIITGNNGKPSLISVVAASPYLTNCSYYDLASSI